MKIEFFVLVSPGKFRELLATVDTNRNTVRVDRVVTKENLEKDIDIACQLSLISPKGICQELKAKADSVEKALGKKDVKFAIQHLEVFLKDLEVKKSKIKEPALTILREEAQTLLDDLNRGQPQVSTDDASPANSNGGFIRDLFSRLTKIFG